MFDSFGVKFILLCYMIFFLSKHKSNGMLLQGDWV